MSKPAPPFLTKAAAAAAADQPSAAPNTREPSPAASHRPATSASDSGSSHLDSILRIPVVVQVFLGAASMPIADLMKLGRDAVVSLDHDIGDPVDVVVNGRVIARGELVALEEDPSKIGVKLIEIVGRPDAAI